MIFRVVARRASTKVTLAPELAVEAAQNGHIGIAAARERRGRLVRPRRPGSASRAQQPRGAPHSVRADISSRRREVSSGEG
jgi:hypothetical protein